MNSGLVGIPMVGLLGLLVLVGIGALIAWFFFRSGDDGDES